MAGRFEGKRCMVVAGTHGIGLAIAKRLVREGARLVIVCSRKQSSVDAALVALRELAPTRATEERVLGTTCNVSSLESIQSLMKFVESSLKGEALDVLVSNAGVDPVSGVSTDLGVSVFDKIFDTNVKAAWRIMKLAKPMLKRGSSVLFVSSTGGLQPMKPSGLYGASKTSLIGLSKVLAEELGPEGIRVNTICPGLVKTRMSEAFWKGPYGPIAEKSLFLQRLGEPEDISSVACFLLSDDASWMTGETVVINGGAHTRL